MDLAAELKTTYGVIVSDCYTAMAQAGLLYFNGTHDEWRANRAKILSTNPPALFGTDLEWETPQSIISGAAKHEGRPSWRPDWPAEFLFIAFARSGAGDEWGFVPSLSKDGDHSVVVYIEHDSDEARFEAPSFESFVFKKAMQSMTGYPHAGDSVAETVSTLRRSIAGVARHVGPGYATELTKLSKSNVTLITEEHMTEKKGVFTSSRKFMNLRFAYQSYVAAKITKQLKDLRLDARIVGGQLEVPT